VLPRDYGAERMAIVATIARARRLTRSAHQLADEGNGLEAMVLLRAVLETTFALGWLKTDSQLAFLIWMLDDLRSTLEQHEEVRGHERRLRRRQRRRGEAVVPVAPSATLGLLERSTLYRRRKSLTEVENRLKGLPQLTRRMRKLRPDSLKPGGPIRQSHRRRLPDYRELSKVAGMEGLYALIYRFVSRPAAHPSPLAVDLFLHERPEGIVVLAEPRQLPTDPYVLGLAALAMALEWASGELPDFDLRPALQAVNPRVDALRALR
jgi:hypothetical protein